MRYRKKEALMVKKIVIFLIAPLLFGCAVGPPGAKDCTLVHPPADRAAEVVIYRPHMLQGSAVPHVITIDKCIVGELHDNSLIRHRIVGGRHKIETVEAELTGEFKPGTTSYVRLWLVNTGKVLFYWHGPIYKHVARFALVDPATAEREIAGLQQPGK